MPVDGGMTVRRRETMKRVIYKGVPMSSASVVLEPVGDILITIGASTMYGVKVFLTIKNNADMAPEEAGILADRLRDAARIANELFQVEEDGMDAVRDRMARVFAFGGKAAARLKENFDQAVRSIANMRIYAINAPQGMDGLRAQADMIAEDIGMERLDEILADAEALMLIEEKSNG
jgi:hypothetical protein